MALFNSNAELDTIEEIIDLTDSVRGYGHVKLKGIKKFYAQQEVLHSKFFRKKLEKAA